MSFQERRKEGKVVDYCRCVDWKSTNMAYECEAVPANEGRPASIRTVRIDQVSIVMQLLLRVP